MIQEIIEQGLIRQNKAAPVPEAQEEETDPLATLGGQIAKREVVFHTPPKPENPVAGEPIPIKPALKIGSLWIPQGIVSVVQARGGGLEVYTIATGLHVSPHNPTNRMGKPPPLKR